MDLHKTLLALFPDYEEGDWRLQNDGSGPFIAEWNRAEPQPPQGQLNAVSDNERAVANENARFKRDFDTADKKQVALVTWIASKHALTYAEATAEIRAIWDAL